MHIFLYKYIVKEYNNQTLPVDSWGVEYNRSWYLVGSDPLRTSATGDEFITLKYGNSVSPRLLNYVEEYVIAGFSKHYSIQKSTLD
jgi:hypothetical protein